MGFFRETEPVGYIHTYIIYTHTYIYTCIRVDIYIHTHIHKDIYYKELTHAIMESEKPSPPLPPHPPPQSAVCKPEIRKDTGVKLQAGSGGLRTRRANGVSSSPVPKAETREC